MTMTIRSLTRGWPLALCMAMPCGAAAADAAAQVPMRDPWVPPAARQAASAASTHGAALNSQVERKLRSSFDAADADHDGSLTLAEARAGGFGMVAEHFERIDTRRSGRVSFEDVKRYLRGRGATTL